MIRKPSSEDETQTPAVMWDRALDWLLRVEAAPDDGPLRSRRDTWLAEDAGHAEAYRRAEHVWHLMGAVPPTVGRATARSRPDRPTRWRRGGLALLAASLAACVALWLAPMLGILVQADYRTSSGEMRNITLSDGSVISLDAGSAIALSNDRAVQLLEGRAFFQVKRDPSHPFTVATGGATVTVLGTAFDVLLSDRSVAVAVQSGSVSVATDPALAVKLQPGQRATVDRSLGALSIDTVGAAGIASWRNGRLVVEDAPVAEVIEELARHHRGLLLLHDPVLAARRVTGVFDLSDPDAALRAVLQPYGGRILGVTPYLLMVEGG